MLEYTAFQDFGLGLRCATQQRPVRTTREESLHAGCGTPIQVLVGIQPVSQSRRNRNDALVLIVREGNENVDRTYLLILRRRMVDVKKEAENREPAVSNPSHGLLTSWKTS